MNLPQTGADARAIRESTGLGQELFARAVGAPFRESIVKIEKREELTWMQKAFYWYIKNFGLPNTKGTK